MQRIEITEIQSQCTHRKIMTKVKIFSELRNKQTNKVTMEANLFSSEFMEVKEIKETP